MVKENNHKYDINLIRKGLEHQYESSDMDTSIFESINDLNLYNLDLTSPSQPMSYEQIMTCLEAPSDIITKFPLALSEAEKAIEANCFSIQQVISIFLNLILNRAKDNYEELISQELVDILQAILIKEDLPNAKLNEVLSLIIKKTIEIPTFPIKMSTFEIINKVLRFKKRILDDSLINSIINIEMQLAQDIVNEEEEKEEIIIILDKLHYYLSFINFQKPILSPKRESKRF